MRCRTGKADGGLDCNGDEVKLVARQYGFMSAVTPIPSGAFAGQTMQRRVEGDGRGMWIEDAAASAWGATEYKH